jgi:hypothetical protein
MIFGLEGALCLAIILGLIELELVRIGWDFYSKMCFCLEKQDSLDKKYGNNFKLLP